jgi:hypothetical protein
MSVFRDGLHLRLSDPTPGSEPHLVSTGSLGSEDSEDEGLEPQRGVGGALNTWTWYRSVPVSTQVLYQLLGLPASRRWKGREAGRRDLFTFLGKTELTASVRGRHKLCKFCGSGYCVIDWGDIGEPVCNAIVTICTTTYTHAQCFCSPVSHHVGGRVLTSRSEMPVKLKAILVTGRGGL